MSASGTPAPSPSIQSANTDAHDATRGSVLPDTRSVVTGEPGSSADTGAGSGPCSSTTCAFVPPRPNDDTAARRGPSQAGPGANSVGRNNRVGDGSNAGFPFQKGRIGGICPPGTAQPPLGRPASPRGRPQRPPFVSP